MLQTKIVCTVGPSCQDEATLLAMIRSGMTVARLNFSHGTYEQHAAMVARLRQLATALDTPLAILQDLSGPKVRIGDIPGGPLELKEGEPLIFTCDPINGPPEPGATPRIYLPFPPLIESTPAGSYLLLDDGTIQCQVERQTRTELECVNIVPGVLQPRKGVNVPGVSFPIESLTPKDREDLKFGVAQGVDWIALSYVRSADDVVTLRKLIADEGADIPIMVKVEKHEAVEALDSIVEVANGVMVARGDLGVELALEDVPLVQKRIISKCNAVGKPVVTATQMLESMLHNPRPTRAEVTDICNAILDGTDAVMLSAETAAGAYPVEAVKVMARVAARTESSLQHRAIVRARSAETADQLADAISEGAIEIALHLANCATGNRRTAIVCATSSGRTARLVSRFRPECPIIAATTNEHTWRQLSISWGVTPVLVERAATFDRMVDNAIDAAVRTGKVQNGDQVVITAGSTIEIVGSTNVIKVQIVGQQDHLGSSAAGLQLIDELPADPLY